MTLEERFKNLRSKISELESIKTKLEGEKEVYKKELKTMGFSSLKEAISKKEELEAEQKELEKELENLLNNLEKEIGSEYGTVQQS